MLLLNIKKNQNKKSLKLKRKKLKSMTRNLKSKQSLKNKQSHKIKLKSQLTGSIIQKLFLKMEPMRFRLE